MAEETITKITYAEPISIELTRGAKGGYQWGIKIRGSEADLMLLSMGMIDAKLRTTYLEPAAEVK